MLGNQILLSFHLEDYRKLLDRDNWTAMLGLSHVQNNYLTTLNTLIFIHYLKNVACLLHLKSLSNKPFVSKCCVFAFLDLTMRKIASLWNLVPVRQQTK